MASRLARIFSGSAPHAVSVPDAIDRARALLDSSNGAKGQERLGQGLSGSEVKRRKKLEKDFGWREHALQMKGRLATAFDPGWQSLPRTFLRLYGDRSVRPTGVVLVVK